MAGNAIPWVAPDAPAISPASPVRRTYAPRRRDRLRGIQEHLTALLLESHGRYRAHIAIVVGPRHAISSGLDARTDPFPLAL